MSISSLLNIHSGDASTWLKFGCSQTRFASVWLVAVRGSAFSLLGTLFSVLALGRLHNREVRFLRKVGRIFGYLIAIVIFIVATIHVTLVFAKAFMSSDEAMGESIICDDTDFPLHSSKESTLYDMLVLYLTSAHITLMYGVAMFSWSLALLTVSRIAVLRIDTFKVEPAGASSSDQFWRAVSYAQLLPMLVLATASFWIRPTFSVFLFKYSKDPTRALIEYPFIVNHWYKHGRDLDAISCRTYSDVIARFVADSLEVGLYLANLAALFGVLSCERVQYSYMFMLMDANVIVAFPKKVTFLANWLKIRASLYCGAVFGTPTREEILAHNDRCVICHEWLSGDSEGCQERGNDAVAVVRLPCHPSHLLHRPCFNLYFLTAHTACNPLRCPICRCDLVEFCTTRTSNQERITSPNINTPEQSLPQSPQSPGTAHDTHSPRSALIDPSLLPALPSSEHRALTPLLSVQELTLPPQNQPPSFMQQVPSASLQSDDFSNAHTSLHPMVVDLRQLDDVAEVRAVGAEIPTEHEAMESDGSDSGTTRDLGTILPSNELQAVSRKRKCQFPNTSSSCKRPSLETQTRPPLTERHLLEINEVTDS